MPKKKKTPDLSHIEPGLRPLATALSDLKPNPRQVNTHNRRSIEAIATSLSDHGQKKPIVANRKGEVIAGWGTVLAAKELGWKHLAVVFSDEDEKGLAKYAIRDNRTSEFSEFDDQMLVEELTRLSDIGTEPVVLGWNEEEYLSLTRVVEEFTPVDPGDLSDLGEESAPKTIICPECGCEIKG